jgi:NhaP-type Na+/H+ or K+/H+ antiporter
VLLLIYSVTLLVAVLLSDRFNRTVLSSAVLFLVVGFAFGPSMLDVVALQSGSSMVMRLSDWALVTILFSDALRIGWGDLRRTWRLPGRALFLGLPLTIAGIAVAGHLLLGLRWTEALLVGAILSPTDPVFASAIVGREEIPGRLRHLLNVESGVNDGLALPFVVVLLGAAAGTETGAWPLIQEVAGGVLFGAGVGALAGRLRRVRVFGVTESAAPLYAFSALLITYSAGMALHVNSYLAAFSAGVALASVCPDAADEFHGLGEQIAELLKLAAVFIFAVMLSSHEAEVPWRDYVFAALVLTFVRFVAIELALLKGGLTRPERLTAAWFGPKGFASVVYGLMLLNSSVARRGMLFQLVAVVIVMSIVLHSSTDVPVAKYFGRLREDRPGT